MEFLNNRDRSDTCLYMVNDRICGANSMTDVDGSRLSFCEEHIHMRPPVLPTFQQWVAALPEPDEQEDSVVPTPAPPTRNEPFNIAPWFRDFTSRLFTETQARTFEDFPAYIEPTRDCCVCFIDSRLLSLPCRHVACFDCYSRLSPKSPKRCPMCREEVGEAFVRRLPSN
jgi:hypothetical protein